MSAHKNPTKLGAVRKDGPFSLEGVMVYIDPQLRPIVEVQEKMEELLETMKEDQRIHARRLRNSLRFLWGATVLNLVSFFCNLFGVW